MSSQSYRNSKLLFSIILFLFMTVPLVSNATDISDKVQFEKSRGKHDRRTKISYFDAAVKNISQDKFLTPVRVVIEDINPLGVAISNQDGFTNENKPYFEYPGIEPGETTNFKTWIFSNPDRKRFSYTTKVLGEIDPGPDSDGDGVPDSQDNCPQDPNKTEPGQCGCGVMDEDVNGNGIADCNEIIPTVSFSTDTITIAKGQTATLTWQSTNADNAFIEPDIGSVPASGTTVVVPEHTITYAISATGPFGAAMDRITVYVTGTPVPQPEGSFGEKYPELIPFDATKEEYDSNRFSLIVGQITDSAGSNLQNVSVKIGDHPEYGTTESDENGNFSIPVEGGSYLTLSYEIEGMIPVHRKVYVPWNDYAVVDTVKMTEEDTSSTTISFDGNPEAIYTHRSTTIEDDYGQRSVTMVMAGDNMAYLVDEGGNDIHPLPSITTRVTEFTSLESMPAALPANSAFTYCSEFSVDNAPRVRFEKPVTAWVTNFLGFEVGEPVPVGYYDRDKMVWVPSDNGVVVMLLDTNNDGIADALDADGDRQPDDLNNSGDFIDEILGLSDPDIYAPGMTFWRFSVSHFTPYDCNWPYGPPEDATAPNPAGEPNVNNIQPENRDCQKTVNSFAMERSRTFHEDIPIPGTDMTLHYASHLVDGYKTAISVPATGSSVPDSLTSVIVKVNIAGRIFTQILDPLPDQKVDIIWDGYDRWGNKVSGSIKAHVEIGFVYNVVYYSARNDLTQAFAQFGDMFTVVQGRQEMTIWKKSEVSVDKFWFSDKKQIAQGWTLSSHHYLDSLNTRLLIKGDGTTITNNNDIIVGIAGNNHRGYSGDGGAAIEGQLDWPQGVAVDKFGNLFIADLNNYCIRKVDTEGIITTVAGTGDRGYSGDGGPAIDAQLGSPYSVAVDSSGNLYICDTVNFVIRKVDTNGIITTIVGNGNGHWGFSGDNGLAVEAEISFAYGLTVDSHNNLYIADTNNHSIRKIDPNGIISTIAGNGYLGYEGDGGSAVDARLNRPWDVAVDSQGNIYIADFNNYCIRKIDISGKISTVAGNGTYGYSGDGGQATEAQLGRPTSIALDKNDNLFIADPDNDIVRRVDTNGIIITIAGNGEYFYGENPGPLPATYGPLGFPEYIAVDSSGNLFLSEPAIYQIRKLYHQYSFAEAGVNGDIPVADKNGMGYLLSSSGLHKKTIDLDTGKTLRVFDYNENGYLISVTDQFGNTTDIKRDDSGIPMAIISPDGLRTDLSIDGYNQLTEITLPDNSAYSFAYDDSGLMTTERDPNNNNFEHTFDANGRLTDIYDDEGGHWQFSRASLSNGEIQTNVFTSEGLITTYIDQTDSTGAYNSTISGPDDGQSFFLSSFDGLTVSKSLSCGLDLEFKYGFDQEYTFNFIEQITESTPSGLVRLTKIDKTYSDTNSDEEPDVITQTLDVNGKRLISEHNILGSNRTVTTPEGRTTTITYDPVTLVTNKISVPGLLDTDFTYDPQGRLKTITTGDRTIEYKYNSSGFLESIIDPKLNETTRYHDAIGRVKQVHRPDTSDLYFDYDANGNMKVFTTPVPADHCFDYNSADLNTSYNPPLSASYSFVYDKDRRPTVTTFPSGRTLEIVYEDDLDRIDYIMTPDGVIKFDYLCGSKIGSLTKGSEVLSYEYDANLLTKERITGTLNQSLVYAYNNDFNLTDFTYAGLTASYSYDDDNLLTAAGQFTITRDPDNGLAKNVSDGNLNISRSFNGYAEVEGQIRSIGSLNLISWVLERDTRGQITNKTETIAGTTTVFDYSYDVMGRLLTVTKDGNLVEAYQYNAGGARVSDTNTLRNITGRTFEYTTEDHLLKAGAATFTHDADGFLTSKTEAEDVTEYTYSIRGELLNVTLPNGDVIEYVHDPLGRRIAKKINGTTTEKYLWQGLTRLLAVYDGVGSLVTRFTYADDRLPVAMTKDGATYYPAFDQAGTLKAVADASGNVVKQIEYDTFGNVINDTAPEFTVPFGFAGGLYDPDTGLVRFGFRDYDPDTGRWTAKDPIFFAGGDTDLYGYVLNDPVNLVDPNGLQGFAIDAGGGYGSGGGGKNSSGSDYGTGIFVGVRPNSGGHAQLGGFTYKSNAEVVPGHRFGGGYTFTHYYGDAEYFFNGTLNYTARNIFGVSYIVYTDPCTGEEQGWSVSLLGDGFGLTGTETGTTTTTSSYFLQK